MVDWRRAILFLIVGSVLSNTDLVTAQNSPALVPSCAPNPCQNNGRCMTTNGQNYCNCESGFVGSTCQYRDPCNRSQCQNGGTCNVVINDVHGPQFTCTCPLGFTASLCEIPLPSACDNSPCMYHGTCQLITLNQSKCICPNGYLGEHCEIIDHCAPLPCKNGATCTPNGQSSGYLCQCADGFQGPICTDDIDECAADKNPCVYGKCTNMPGSYRCECNRGYTGKNCDQVYVPCEPTPCVNEGRCVVLGQFKYLCQCPAGYTGKNCEQNIDDCVNHSCRNGGKCVDGLNNYTCKCPETYRGQFCTEDVDECAENKYMCQNSGTCHNTIGGFQCICVNGWEGKYCSINRDDCKDGQCFNGGTCIDRVGTFSCNCSIGWTGLLCHLRDACISSPCQGRGKCDTNPVDGSYLCSCASGFKGGDCSLDIDECASGDNPCEHQGTCVNTPGSYRCECAAGWTGEFCDQNVNECSSNPCQNRATCLDDVGFFRCLCLPGFTGKHCEINVNDRACSSAPCLNGGKCRSQPDGTFRCECALGYVGDRCQTDVDECSSHSCENNATCIDQIGKFACVCPPGYTGTYCETNIGDRACASGPCLNGGRCRSAVNGFVCECAQGYDGARCENDLDECAARPCQNGGTCRDGPNSYACKCPLGFIGRQCEINENDCQVNSCLNNGTCIDGINNFTCQCPRGYRGNNCQLRDSLDGLYKEVDIRETEMCRLNNCDKKADDGVCHPECNYYACGFDGDDCSAGLKPFKRCQSPCYCWHRFQDGTCDPECNNEECLFDGYDCVTGKNDICNPLYVAYCTSHFRDGHCDSGCNTSGCNYDGGDCEVKEHEKPKEQLQGSIVMIVTVDPELFINNSNRFLMVVGKLVDATVTIQRDDGGRPMIYRWNSRDGVDKSEPVAATSSLIAWNSRGKRQTSMYGTTPQPFFTGTLVVLTVDISRCVAAGRTDCFKEIISVADFLGAASAKEALKQTLGWDVYSISADEPSAGTSSNPTVMWVVGVVVAGAVVLLIAMMIVREKRKRTIQSTLWTPEGYGGPKPKTCRHEETSLDRNTAVPNQYEPDHGFIRSTCSSTTTSRSRQTSCAANGYETHLGDYLNHHQHPHWNNQDTGRPDSYSQCSDNETSSTYAESQCTVAPTPVPHIQYHANILPGMSTMKGGKQYFPTTIGPAELGWHKEHLDAVCSSDEKYVAPSKEMINVKGPDGVTPLIAAIREGTTPVCLQLISQGADLNAQTVALEEGPLITAVRHQRTDVVKLMIQSGADTNVYDAQGYTPLHHAVMVNDAELVSVVLSNRSTNIDAEADRNCTPLILAAMMGAPDTKVIELLLNHGAKVAHKDHIGRTAMHWAAATGNTEAITLLHRKGADKDAQDDKDETPLLVAARENNIEAVRRLLELGANKDITDQTDRLPKDMAIERDHREIIELLDMPHGALLNASGGVPMWKEMSQKPCRGGEYGTLPHNATARRAKPKPLPRSDSLKSTARNASSNGGMTAGAMTMDRKKTPQKKSQSQHHRQAVEEMVHHAPPQMPISTAILVGKQSPPSHHHHLQQQMQQPSIVVVPPSSHGKTNSPLHHPSIICSPSYLMTDSSTNMQTPNFSYHQPQHQQQQQRQPPSCTFSPPNAAAFSPPTFSPPSVNSVGATSYGCSSATYSAPGSVGSVVNGNGGNGGGGAYYHRSPEAAATCINSPPPYPQTRTDTAMTYNLATGTAASSPPSSNLQQQQQRQVNPGYTQLYATQSTGDYVDYCSANGPSPYDLMSNNNGQYQTSSQMDNTTTVGVGPIQESEVDGFYQHQYQNMWNQRDMYQTS